MAADYLSSIADRPLLCIGAVNPGERPFRLSSHVQKGRLLLFALGPFLALLLALEIANSKRDVNPSACLQCSGL